MASSTRASLVGSLASRCTADSRFVPLVWLGPHRRRPLVHHLIHAPGEDRQHRSLALGNRHVEPDPVVSLVEAGTDRRNSFAPQDLRSLGGIRRPQEPTPCPYFDVLCVTRRRYLQVAAFEEDPGVRRGTSGQVEMKAQLLDLCVPGGEADVVEEGRVHSGYF